MKGIILKQGLLAATIGSLLIISTSASAWSLSPMSEARKAGKAKGMTRQKRLIKTTCNWTLFKKLPNGSVHACGISYNGVRHTVRIKKENRTRFSLVK